MSELIDYFVRHYTLVIDNDQSTYWPVTRAAVGKVRDSGITAREWRELSAGEREERFAEEIGEAVAEMISAWLEESISDRDHAGSLIVREICFPDDSAVVRGLGAHYVPEDADIVHLLPEGDDED
jgi:hypothetical protein